MIEVFSYGFVQLAVLGVLIMAVIHAYLGFHVVSRGVIFVDLSLAQVSALGAAVATIAGLEHGLARYLISLGFTFLGALVITVARTRDDRVPQEAFIGIIYAGSTAVAILLLAHDPSGTEELQHMLAGSLLTITPGAIARIAGLYAAVGLFHFVFRDRFVLISTRRREARERGFNLFWWDFLFYAAFALVVTASVPIAGVLLVFSLLVIPPVAALLLTSDSRLRLSIGSVVALIGSVAGIVLSVGLDLPAGPSVMVALVGLLLIAVLARSFGRT